MRLHALLLAASLFVAHGAASQNLLVSPDFDVASDVDDWPDPSPDPDTQIGWQSDVDVDGSPSSGSLRLQNSISAGVVDGPRQCVIAGTGLYEFSSWVFNPTQVPQPQTIARLEYFSGNACNGTFLAFDEQYASGALDTWDPVDLLGEAPASTASIGVRLFSGNTVDPTVTTVYWDAIFLPEPGRSPGGAAAALALAVLARRRATTARRRS